MKSSTFNKHCDIYDEYLINGNNGAKAWKKFHPKVSNETAAVNFCRMLTNAKIQEYAKKKHEQIRRDHNITLAGQLEKLDRLREGAEGAGKFGDAISAVKEESKLAALYEEDNKQKQPKVNIPISNWVKGTAKGIEEMENFDPNAHK